MRQLTEIKKYNAKKELIQEYVNLNIASVRNMPNICVSSWEQVIKRTFNNKSISEIKKAIKLTCSLNAICTKNTNKD